MSVSDDPECLFLPNGEIRSERFSKHSLDVLQITLDFARRTKWESVRTPHLFMGLLAKPDAAVREWGNRLGANLNRLLTQFEELFQAEAFEDFIPLRLNREFLSDNVIHLLREAQQRTREMGRYIITPLDLLVSVFTVPNSIVAACFHRIGLTSEQLAELAILAEREVEPD